MKYFILKNTDKTYLNPYNNPKLIEVNSIKECYLLPNDNNLVLISKCIDQENYKVELGIGYKSIMQMILIENQGGYSQSKSLQFNYIQNEN